MANVPSTAIRLLDMIRTAAEYDDFEVVANTLERMLQPWSMRVINVADDFTEEDADLLGEFWRKFLDLRPSEDILKRASVPYMVALGASINTKYIEVHELAEEQCASIFLLSNFLLTEQGVQEANPYENVLQFTRRPIRK